MAVMGLEAFRERFKEYEDCYTIIGGTACDILMAEALFIVRLFGVFVTVTGFQKF